MADTLQAHLWPGRLAFVLLCFALAAIQILPVDTMPGGWPGPDLLLAVILIWTARRPDLAPVYLVALVAFGADLLFQRPPGLWSGLIVVITEMMRRRAVDFRHMPFLAEWGVLAFAVLALAIAYRIGLAIVILPRPSLGLTLIQAGMTILSCPLVALAAHIGLGISRPALGEMDDQGRRL